MANTRPTPAKIEEWKKEHGNVFQFTVEGKIVIMREPKMVDLERASASDPKKKKPFNFFRSITANCKLYEDEGFFDDDKREMALHAQMDEIIEIKEAEVKKL